MEFGQAIRQISEILDPRLLGGFTRELAHEGAGVTIDQVADRSVVLVGHRAAGKTSMLPILANLLRRPSIDLDDLIASATGRTATEWVQRDLKGFRTEESRLFQQIQPPAIVAVGGGFLSNHPNLLRGQIAVLIPITFETYRSRLLADVTRPRLRPTLSLDEEIKQVFEEREIEHAKVSTVALVDLLRAVRGIQSHA